MSPNNSNDTKVGSFSSLMCMLYHKKKHPRKDGAWMYPPSKQVLEMAGLFSIQEYVALQKNAMK
jgi:hypothetical protein